MSLSVNGKSCHLNSLELFNSLSNSSEAQRFANDVKAASRLQSLESIAGKLIGTIDATSCIGVAYFHGRAIVVQHVDGRDFRGLQSIFDDIAFNKSNEATKVCLVGGSRMQNNAGAFINDYKLLEPFTRENLEGLVQYWDRNSFKIDIQGWAIGDFVDVERLHGTLGIERLCPDFVASEGGKIQLLQSGAAIAQGLVPEQTHRHACYSADWSSYIPVYDSRKGAQFTLPALPSPLPQALIHNAMEIKNYRTDKQLLMESSTTPNHEPLHFCKDSRDKADYLLNDKADKTARIVPWKDKPVIALQGEVVRTDIPAPNS